MKVIVDVKNSQTTEAIRGSDMMAKGVTEVHTTHAMSTYVKCEGDFEGA